MWRLDATRALPPARHADIDEEEDEDMKQCHHPGGQPVAPQACDTCADEAGCERRRTTRGPIFECPDYSMPF